MVDVDVGFSHVLDEDNLTQAQEKCLDLDIQATNIMYRSLDDCIFGEITNMKTAHEIWIYLNEKYGMVSDDDDDEPMGEVHEDVEHDHNLVIVEYCSTSWSSDDDDDSTTRSLDKIDGDDDGSCSDYESDVSLSSPTISHCFISQGDTKVSNANMIDIDSYEELLDRYGCMIKV